MKALSLITPIDPEQLEKETLRIYEVCDGCRRCFNLCPSFNTLLDRIDGYEGDVAKLTPADHHRSSTNATTVSSASIIAPILRRITTKSTFRI